MNETTVTLQGWLGNDVVVRQAFTVYHWVSPSTHVSVFRW